jgi:hypothetical protein
MPTKRRETAWRNAVQRIPGALVVFNRMLAYRLHVARGLD